MSLLQTYTTQKQSGPLPIRLALHAIDLILLTTLLYTIPTALHQCVTSIDAIYTLLSRQAHSPYAPAVSWTEACLAGGILLVWHVVLGRLGYIAINEGKGTGVSWGRVLGRIVIPGLLLVLGVRFVVEVMGRVGGGTVMVGNVVDGKEVEGELMGR